MWYGHSSLDNTDLFAAQIVALAAKMDKRMENDTETARASGILVNTNGWIQNDGYQMLLKTIEAMRITVVLVMGHDRLYSMLKSSNQDKKNLKVIKLPRSGGVVSRDSSFVRASRSLAIKRYFYGDFVEGPNSARVPSLTPFLAHVEFKEVQLYKLTSVALSASLLPVSAKQSTEPVQLTTVDITEKLQHALLAVCHPAAVQAFQKSGRARDLYESGVAGFVAVERVLTDTEMLHLLCPCAGSLPSYTLLTGDITWME
jgi:polyribonucleotide 5'-hydroxyl-kinase